MSKSPSAGTPAVRALRAAGVSFTLQEYPHDPRAASYGREAAEFLAATLGVLPEQVFKTLMVSADGHLAVGIVPVTAQLDLKAIARALGASRAALAEVSAAERATGYVAGGISPLGQKRSHPTVLDTTAEDHDPIFVSAGRRGLDVALAPADLVRLTGAAVAPISR